MSKIKILSALKKKGITPQNVEYVRNEPTPSGYAAGWEIELSEYDSETYCEEVNNDLDTFDEVMEWIESIEIDIKSVFHRWFLSIPDIDEKLLNDVCSESGEYMNEQVNSMFYSFKYGFLESQNIKEQAA